MVTAIEPLPRREQPLRTSAGGSGLCHPAGSLTLTSGVAAASSGHARPRGIRHQVPPWRVRLRDAHPLRTGPARGLRRRRRRPAAVQRRTRPRAPAHALPADIRPVPTGQQPQRCLIPPLAQEYIGQITRARTTGHVWAPSWLRRILRRSPLEIVKEYIRGQKRPDSGRAGASSRPGTTGFPHPDPPMNGHVQTPAPHRPSPASTAAPRPVRVEDPRGSGCPRTPRGCTADRLLIAIMWQRAQVSPARPRPIRAPLTRASSLPIRVAGPHRPPPADGTAGHAPHG
jgi:hypothetical protein